LPNVYMFKFLGGSGLLPIILSESAGFGMRPGGHR